MLHMLYTMIRTFIEKCWSALDESRAAKRGCREKKGWIIRGKSRETKSSGVAWYNRERGLITKEVNYGRKLRGGCLTIPW